jgi:ribonuclease Z
MINQSNSLLYDIWKYSYDLPGTQLTIRGHSRGSEKSCFYIPEIKTFLDAGCDSYFNPDYIFVTHCHSDHSFQLPMILTGLDRKGKGPPRIHAPIESQQLFQNFIQTTYQLRKGTVKAKGHFKVTGLSPGQEVDLNKEGYYVCVYDMHHNVPTRGYGVCQRRKKLNPLFYGKSGKDLKILKKGGVDINIYINEKLVVYVLDTNINCFNTSPELLQYKNVMVECTFFKDETSDHHIHWSQLKIIVMNNPNTNFILIHFSMRYTWDEIDKFFANEKEIYPNIMPWMN